MKSFFDKDVFTMDEILSLITNEAEESIHLDFKEANAFDKSEGKKKDISKDIASFANSDGGIIIYGIKEVNHKAHSVSYIDGNIYTKEWLEQIINSSIQRRIADIKIYPLRNNNNIEETIYIVKVPKSLNAPHLSKDKKFYKRFNFESVPMEEYEIRQLYGQKIKSKLILHKLSVSQIGDNDDDLDFDKLNLRLEVSIVNIGDIVEENYKLNIYIDGLLKEVDIRWPRVMSHYDHMLLDNDRVKVSSTGQHPIYPEEIINAIRFTMHIPNPVLDEVLDSTKIEIRLLYLNGEDIMTADLKGLKDQVPKIEE